MVINHRFPSTCVGSLVKHQVLGSLYQSTESAYKKYIQLWSDGIVGIKPARLLWWHRIIYFVIENAMCNYMHLLGNGHPEKEKNERKSCSMVKQRIDENLFILHGRPKFELFAVCSSRYQTQMGSLIKLWKGNHLSPWSLQQTSINTQRMIIYSLPLFPFRLLLGTWTLPRLLSEKARHALPMAVSVAL